MSEKKQPQGVQVIDSETLVATLTSHAGADNDQTFWRLGIADGVPALSHFITRDSNE